MSEYSVQYDLFGEPTIQSHGESEIESLVAGAIFDFAAFVAQTSEVSLNWTEAIKDFAAYRCLQIDNADPMWELSLQYDRQQS